MIVVVSGGNGRRGVVTWATNFSGVTLVQERLDEAKAFYKEVFEVPGAPRGREQCRVQARR